jgi:hypothetical protein
MKIIFSMYFNVVMLFDNDGDVLDSKLISFKTMEGCIYCPDGVCECQVNA